ncbi:MAG: phosphopantetheine-binding protein [Planctomycetaceae bacterium]
MNDAVTTAVEEAIGCVLADRGRHGIVIHPHSRLGADIGLDSLDVAQAVVLLERSLGIDPFRRATTIAPLRTVADLIAAYVTALRDAPGLPD